ncbi:15421_t:CDS:2 [Dentiscutata heterogama]|uniref:15421_t:CDS:1 n=1 Tax=Dentiscutata heterogama TaxID=1316150 RepID=A0ACA9KI28_9GLOM|nr:15421_t:CDS:2 [Dentiscutata heterogama]
MSKISFFDISLFQLIGYALLILLAKLLYHLIYNLYLSPLSKIPSPFLCSISSIPIILRRPEGKIFKWFFHLHKQFGPVVRIGPSFVLFSSKNAVKQILTTDNLPKSDSLAGIRSDPNFPTLFSATEKTFHQKRRKLLSSAFSIKYISTLEPLMRSCTDVLLQKISSLSNNSNNVDNTLNIYELIQACTLDIIGETAFGGSFNIVEKGNHPLPEKVFQELKRRVMCHTFPYLKSFMFILKIIKERRELNDQGKKRNDILQTLLDSKEVTDDPLTEFEIQDQIMEFVIAGSDTGSLTINMALIMLLYHPEKLEALVSELDSLNLHQSSSTLIPSHDSLKNLKYLNAVIYETLRLFPASIGGILRQTTKDTVIDGYFIPKDTAVSASIWTVHKSKEIWGPDADDFVPERWINSKNSSMKNAFYGFGAGSRNCIGVNFAWMEMRLLLASLLLNFKFEMVKNQDLDLVHFITPALKSKKFLVGVKSRH